MFRLFSIALLVNAAFAANINLYNSGFKSGLSGSSIYSSAPTVVSGSRQIQIGNSGLLTSGLSGGLNGASIVSSAPTTYTTGLTSGLSSDYLSSDLKNGLSGASIVSSAPTTYTTGLTSGLSSGVLSSGISSGNILSGVSTGNIVKTGLNGGVSYVVSSGAPTTYSVGYRSTGDVPQVISRSAGQTSQGYAKNVYGTITRVEPGDEIEYKIRTKPEIHRQAAVVAQVIPPKVEVQRVYAPPQVEHVTLVKEQKPDVVKIVPQIHKETVVLEHAKPKPQLFLSQKAKHTIVKKIEYDQHKITGLVPENVQQHEGAIITGNGASIVTSTDGALNLGNVVGNTGATVVTSNQDFGHVKRNSANVDVVANQEAPLSLVGNDATIVNTGFNYPLNAGQSFVNTGALNAGQTFVNTGALNAGQSINTGALNVGQSLLNTAALNAGQSFVNNGATVVSSDAYQTGLSGLTGNIATGNTNTQVIYSGTTGINSADSFNTNGFKFGGLKTLSRQGTKL